MQTRGKTIFWHAYPIIRTFALSSGVGKMRYGFSLPNFVGGWLEAIMLFCGYVSAHKICADNFSLVILAIIVISFSCRD